MLKTINPKREEQKITQNNQRVPIVETNAPESYTLLDNSEDGVIVSEQYQLDGKSDFEIWFHAIDEDIVTAGTLDVDFYRNVSGEEVYIETVTATIPVTITAGEVGRVVIVPTDAIASYTSFKISGTVAVETDGKVSLTAYLRDEGDAVKITDGTQKTQIVDGTGNVIDSTANALDVNVKSSTAIDEAGAEIDGTASASITDTSSTVTLTQKSEVRNTGTNTVYVCEGSGTATDADFPIYPDETILLKAGTFDAICGAGLTSTLKILKVS